MALFSDCVSGRIDLDGLVNDIATKLERRLNKPGIFILASPGCSRGRLVTVLLRRGLVDVVYAYGGFGSKVGDDVRGRVIEFGRVDDLVGKLGSVDGRVAVVARSTTDAVRLRDILGNAELIYLPKYYKDAAKEALSGDGPEVAGVRHEGLGEGVSPSMLREGVPSEVVESIRKLSPGRLGLRDLVRDFLKKAPISVAGTQAITLGLSFLFGAGVAVGLAGSLAGRFLESVVGKWRKNKDEVLGGLVRLVSVAREVRNYLDDERFEAVVDEVAYEWGLSIEEFTNTIKNIANIAERKQLTDEDIKKIINDKLTNIEEELDKVRERVRDLLVDVKVFFIEDIENGLLYGNFIVEGGVPKIKTWVGTAKNEQNKQSELEPLETALVDVGTFRKVAEEVFSKFVKDGRVVLIGPRGIGKSTLATYVAWRSLLGGLGNVVLDKPMDAAIHIESLGPGDAVKLNNLVETTGRRFVVIYDPSPIEAYYKPEAMQVVKHGTKSDENTKLRKLIESVKNTLKELMEVRNAWVVIILPRELYEQVQRGREEDVDLRQVLDNLERDVVTVNLGDEVFLREIIKRYSGCDNVSNDLVRRVMNFNSYTFVAKYAGIWLRERGCGVEDVDKALRESAGEPKLFFANYIWGTILGKKMDLAKKVSVPLILHATFGPIPEGITYITKAVNEGGAWKLIDRDNLAKLKLEDLREDDLEPIAKWLSTSHEDLIEETLKELVGLQDEEARKYYIDHGLRNLIEALKWGYEKVGGLGREVKPEEVVTNLLIFVSERLKNALKPYANCWKRTALIIGLASAGIDLIPRIEDLRKDENLRKDVVKSLGNALNRCGVDDLLLVDNEIPPLIMNLVLNTRALTEAFIDKYNETIDEVRRVLNIARKRGNLRSGEAFYGLGLASIIANAAESGMPVGPSDADAALHIASFAMSHVRSTHHILQILSALAPLRDKAPQRYLEVLALALNKVSPPFLCPDWDTVMNILNEFDYILNKYGDGAKEYAWTLIPAISALTYSLYNCLVHCDDYTFEYVNASFRIKLEHVVSRVAGLLDKINRLNPSLDIIAWSRALQPALKNKCVKALMERVLGIDVVNKAKEVAGELSGLKGSVQELARDQVFMGFVKSWLAEADEKAAKRVILEETSILKYALAQYKLNNDELDEAERLFNEVAVESKEIGVYVNYLYRRRWALRVEAIKSPLAGDDLVKLVHGFRQLYEEAVDAKCLMSASPYNGTLWEIILRDILGGYLVSLALTGGDKEIRRIEELLKEQWQVLGYHAPEPILTRLVLNALLSPRAELSSKLKDRLVVKPGEIIVALGLGYIDINSLPALKATYGTIELGDETRLCEEINDRTMYDHCVGIVLTANIKELFQQEGNLSQVLIDSFQRWISKRAVLDLLEKLGLDAESLNDELKRLTHELSGKSLQSVISFSYCYEHEQLSCSLYHLAYMLYALINGNEKLAKAHALAGAMIFADKLPVRLFLEAYGACCDTNNEEFRRAIAKLFFYHV
jgi:hypothetical protein